MIRSNIGNITTNAMQTLNISASQYAKLERKKEDASTALNASSSKSGGSTSQNNGTAGTGSPSVTPINIGQKRNASGGTPENTVGGFPNVQSDGTMPNMGDEFNERVYQMTQHFLPSDSPQAQAIGQYIRNNLDWFERRRNRKGGM